MWTSIVGIAAGASCGAVLRWVLGNQLNALFPFVPPGTLAANLLGGYLIGVAIAFFADHPALPPEVRLLVVTGFVGGLTTFSTFSAEVMALLQEERFAWAFGAIVIHVVGSLGMVFLGMLTVSLLRRT